MVFLLMLGLGLGRLGVDGHIHVRQHCADCTLHFLGDRMGVGRAQAV
jgi:hypothetical protein